MLGAEKATWGAWLLNEPTPEGAAGEMRPSSANGGEEDIEIGEEREMEPGGEVMRGEGFSWGEPFCLVRFIPKQSSLLPLWNISCLYAPWSGPAMSEVIRWRKGLGLWVRLITLVTE